jgi:hypothetical protein
VSAFTLQAGARARCKPTGVLNIRTAPRRLLQALRVTLPASGSKLVVRIEIARPRKSQRDAAPRDDVGNPVPGRKHANRTFLQ